MNELDMRDIFNRDIFNDDICQPCLHKGTSECGYCNKSKTDNIKLNSTATHTLLRAKYISDSDMDSDWYDIRNNKIGTDYTKLAGTITSTLCTPEYSDWKCYMFGKELSTNFCFVTLKGDEPCWFHRKMQELCFGHHWVKTK